MRKTIHCLLFLMMFTALAFGQKKAKHKAKRVPECKPPLCIVIPSATTNDLMVPKVGGIADDGFFYGTAINSFTSATGARSEIKFDYFRFEDASRMTLRLGNDGILHVKLGGKIKQVIIEPEAKWSDLAGMIL